ncbi:hypothetical protein BS78_08G121200 [Paspalum vaginatum]|nr:hypothetical protein BS78_08G121200 [Paspalum vaginatum]
MAHISDIKLIRTDTTLDLSQKAEKGMNCPVRVPLVLCRTPSGQLLWIGSTVLILSYRHGLTSIRPVDSLGLLPIPHHEAGHRIAFWAGHEL